MKKILTTLQPLIRSLQLVVSAILFLTTSQSATAQRYSGHRIAPVEHRPVATEISPLKNPGRAGRAARIRELAADHKVSSADRGWFKQEHNSMARGQRSSARLPPDRELAHQRGFEAAKGYGYQKAVLQAPEMHKIQHKYDNMGRRQTTPTKK